MWSIEEAAQYYRKQGAPGDQSALVAFLQELQEECGGRIPAASLPEAAELLGTKESFLLAVIKRFPSLRLADVHTLELCGGPNCGKAKALAACAEKLQKERGFTLKFVPCMRLCGKGPNLKWDGKLYHGATEALLKDLTNK
jgi:NADH:ubiquinone oxidoreductase subunit E